MVENQSQVFVLGGVSIDYKMISKNIPKENELVVSDCFSFDAGGRANCQACALAKLGVQAYLISCIGTEDPLNIAKLSKWKKIGLNTEFVKQIEGKTSTKTLIENGNGKNSICEYMGNNLKIEKEQINLAFEKAKEGDYFIATYEAGEENVNISITNAKYKNMITVLIPSPVPTQINILESVDYLIVYKKELEKLMGKEFNSSLPTSDEIDEFFQSFSFPNLKLIIFLGPKEGTIYKSKDFLIYTKSPDINVLDNTNCRTAFIGGFIYKLILNENIQNSLKFGNFSSAYCAMNIGAINSLPSLENVEKLIREIEN